MESNKTAELKVLSRNGRSTPTGLFTTNANGKRKEVLTYSETYMTPSGPFTPKQWKEKAMAAVKVDGKEDLLEKIKQYCGLHCAWLHQEDDIEEYALDCLCHESYKSWGDFEEEEIWQC